MNHQPTRYPITAEWTAYSHSYPLLSIARRFGLDYGDVLSFYDTYYAKHPDTVVHEAAVKSISHQLGAGTDVLVNTFEHARRSGALH